MRRAEALQPPAKKRTSVTVASGPRARGRARASAGRIATYPLLYLDVRMDREALQALEDVANGALDAGQVVVVPALGELSCPGPENLQ